MGTSICERAARPISSASATLSDDANAARMRQMLEWMWVKTIVLMRPTRLKIQAATGKERAHSTPDQKKKRLVPLSATHARPALVASRAPALSGRSF